MSNSNLQKDIDNIIVESNNSKIIFNLSTGKFDIYSPNFCLKNVLTSINIEPPQNFRIENIEVSKRTNKILKNLIIFIPHFQKEKISEVKIEEGNFDLNSISNFDSTLQKIILISNSKFSMIGSFKLLTIPLVYKNSKFQGTFHAKLILCLNNAELFYPASEIFFSYIIIESWEDFDQIINPPKIHSISPLLLDESSIIIFNNSFSNNKNKITITFFRNGYQSWSICNLLFQNKKAKITPTSIGKINLQNQDEKISVKWFSEMVTAITHKDLKSSVIIGFVTHADQFSRILMNKIIERKNNSMSEFKSEISTDLLMALSQLDGIYIDKLKLNKNSIQSELLCIIGSAPYQGFINMNKWAQITGIFMNTKLMMNKIRKLNSILTNNSKFNNFIVEKSTEPLIGWCSWYYYYQKINENEMMKNIEFFKNHPEIPLEIIQLDDGYQTAIGDFTSINEKFPRCRNHKDGMKFLTDIIHGNMFIAGIWIAPFFASPKSNLFKLHPDWFLKNKNNQLIKATYNWGSFQYALDISKPEVQNHIKNLINTIIKDWKFDFIKIDFIYALSVINAMHSDPSITRAQMLRNGVFLIKNVMGDNILLGCGAPLGPCIGLVDTMRIGPDTAAYWQFKGILGDIIMNSFNLAIPCLKAALLNTILRSFMHNALWINDPDCVIVRKNNSKLTINEIQLQLTIFGLSGGQIFFSDDLELLDNERLSLMSLLIPSFNFQHEMSSSKNKISCDIAIPIDGLIRCPPIFYGKYISSNIGERIHISIINWKNNPSNLNKESIKIYEILKSFNAESLIKNYTKFIIFDFWNAYNKIYDSQIIYGLIDINHKIPIDLNIQIPSHGCKYFGIIPVKNDDLNHPIFLGSTIHIMQGINEIKKFNYNSNDLKIDLFIETENTKSGSIFILLPSNLEVFNENTNIFQTKKYEILSSNQQLQHYSILEVQINIKKSCNILIDLRLKN